MFSLSLHYLPSIYLIISTFLLLVFASSTLALGKSFRGFPSSLLEIFFASHLGCKVRRLLSEMRANIACTNTRPFCVSRHREQSDCWPFGSSRKPFFPCRFRPVAVCRFLSEVQVLVDKNYIFLSRGRRSSPTMVRISRMLTPARCDEIVEIPVLDGGTFPSAHSGNIGSKLEIETIWKNFSPTRTMLSLWICYETVIRGKAGSPIKIRRKLFLSPWCAPLRCGTWLPSKRMKARKRWRRKKRFHQLI